MSDRAASVPIAANASRPYWRVRVIVALAIAFLALSLISGIAYIAVLAGAAGTTELLLVDRTRRGVEAEIQLVRSRLDPVTEQIELIAALAAAGRIDIESAVAVREALAVMMTRAPAVSAAAFGTLDLKLHRVSRDPQGEVIRDTVELAEMPQGLERFRQLQGSSETFWGALFWNTLLLQPVINVRTPVRRIDNAFIGGIVATVAVGDLSRLIVDPARGGEERYFILAGRDKVLAHRRLVDPRGLALSEEKPLPGLSEVDDPVLAGIWGPRAGSARVDGALRDLGHVIEVAGRRWIFVYRPLVGYGPEPWIVGRYFPIEDATDDLDRLTNGAIVGAASLLIAALLALLIGLRMARSIRVLTDAAEAIERLEFDRPLDHRSRLREIDDAGLSLEKARAALKWFGAYVPRRLVFRLMAAGEDGLASRRRDVTVMFTDIVAFTPQAEDLPEQETADLLNHHFALLGACIEQEQGMIDKYIGDCVMAVWGGISRMNDHADAAIRAARVIAEVVRHDNAARRARGLAPVRLRIGLHSGRAIVGNIGAPGRVNYTVVGDTVNVAQRFEQMGKEFMSETDEVVLLVSGDTIEATTDRSALGRLPDPVMRHVKGRDQPVEVYRLV